MTAILKDCDSFPLAAALSASIPLSFAVQLQSLDNGFLYFLYGRPRWKISGDPVFGHPELLNLVWFFLLHNSQQHLGIQLAFLGKTAYFNGLPLGGRT